MSGFDLEAIMRASMELERENMVENYLAGVNQSELMRRTGLARSTVQRRLVAAGVLARKGSPGPVRKTHCKWGHNLALYGVELKSGGRLCGECRRIKQRLDYLNAPDREAYMRSLYERRDTAGE